MGSPLDRARSPRPAHVAVMDSARVLRHELSTRFVVHARPSRLPGRWDSHGTTRRLRAPVSRRSREHTSQTTNTQKCRRNQSARAPGSVFALARLEVERLDLRPRPGRPPKKLEARRDAWIEVEAANGDTPAHLFPAETLDEPSQDRLQRHSVERVLGHGRKLERPMGRAPSPSADPWPHASSDDAFRATTQALAGPSLYVQPHELKGIFEHLPPTSEARMPIPSRSGASTGAVRRQDHGVAHDDLATIGDRKGDAREGVRDARRHALVGQVRRSDRR